MSEPDPFIEDSRNEQRIEYAIALLLRAGVLLAAFVVLIGGGVYLLRHGQTLPDYRTFHGEPSQFRRLDDIVAGAFQWSGRDIILLGLFLLIATPVLRVAFAAWAFFRQSDRFYTGIALLVLAILAYSLALSS